MPSTYTLNNGIELIATGEQSGTWGDTTNTNFQLLDTSLDGQVTVTLASTGSSGSPNTLPVSDGAASNGRNRLVIFDDSSDLGGTAFVQLTPNDAEKIIYVRNSLSGSRSILLFQGTYNASNDYEVPAGTTAVVFFNGAGSGAVAANVFNNAHFDNLNIAGDVTVGDDLSLNSDGAIINIGADADLQITHSGSEGTITNATGDLTLDVAGDIILDADGSDFKFRDGGAGFFTISNSSLDAVLKVEQSNEDFIIKGNDGGSEITALTLDMSEAGAATFNAGVTLSGDLTVDTNTLYVDATNNRVGIINGSPSHPLDVDGEVRFKSNIRLKEATSGSETGSINLADSGLMSIQAFATVGEIAFDTGSSALEAMRIDTSQRVLIGATSNTAIGGHNAATQIVGSGSYHEATLTIQGNENNSNGAYLGFSSSRGTTAGSTTIVQDDDTLGQVYFAGADGTDLGTVAAAMTAQVDGTPGSNDMPGRLLFSTTADGSASLTERMRINSSGYVGIGGGINPQRPLVLYDGSSGQVQIQFQNNTTGTANTDGFGVGLDTAEEGFIWNYESSDIYVGNSSANRILTFDGSGTVLTGTDTVDTNFSGKGIVQIAGENSAPLLTVTRYQANSSGAYVRIGKSRGTSPNTRGILSDGDDIGYLQWVADDGQNVNTGAAQITAAIDGTPGANDLPGRLVFYTTADGASSGTERMRISSDGNVHIGNSQSLYFAGLIVGDGANTRGITIYTGTASSGVLAFADGTSGSARYSGYIEYDHANNNMNFYTVAGDIAGQFAGTNKNFKVNAGNIIIGTSGKGIDFSATGNSSGTTTSELLDDYEEGTFTPNLTGTGGAFSGATYGTQSGKYTKVGDTVTVIVHIVASVVVGGSGSLAVGNLPFAANSACGAAIGYISGLNYDDNTYNQVGLYMTTSGGSRIIFTVSGDSVSATEVTIGGFTSDFNCVFTATYKTA